ncbi:hypothetical protein COCNU_10G008660 [Cocos nucifera]|uniref:Uncharacterized protein n=1 Tax=Cocos nucifera TaxID=13894 RepID=A0A8K0IN56_COCNU|nr:hypothetical protein COCNU_10G008660 [Cocos nucifera]
MPADRPRDRRIWARPPDPSAAIIGSPLLRLHRSSSHPNPNRTACHRGTPLLAESGPSLITFSQATAIEFGRTTTESRCAITVGSGPMHREEEWRPYATSPALFCMPPRQIGMQPPPDRHSIVGSVRLESALRCMCIMPPDPMPLRHP